VLEHRLRTVRRARYFTAGGTARPLPEAWLVLHGVGQLAAKFLAYHESIVTPERLVIAPEALNRYYVSRSTTDPADAKPGATWMTREDRENEIADYVDFLDAVWHETASGAHRVTVLGFSQGVATACRWVARGQSRIDRLVSWAGQIPPDVDAAALGVLRDGVTLVAGEADEYATWLAEGDHEARLAAAGVSYEVVTFPGGHRMDRETLQRVARGPGEVRGR
jgi:predicted esterase